MTQPPNMTPPPPLSAGDGGVPAAFAPPPGYAPPPNVGPPSSGPAGRGRVSPTRLILVFVVVLGIGLALGAAVVVGLQPGAKKPDCPDPTVACGAPPVAATLPPIAAASPTGRSTPAPTIVRPSGTLVIPSAAASGSASAAATSSPAATQVTSASAVPSVPPTTSPSATPTATPAPPIANLPQPRPASNAAPLHTGTVWTSSAMGFSFEYNDKLWAIQNEGPNGIALTAGNGAVIISVEGFNASDASTKALIQQKVKAIGDVVLGLTEEADPSRQLPGKPVVGHRQGLGTLLNGTLNTPQGPGANVDLVVLAATDSRISIRVTLLCDDDLRDAAFSVVDSILNSIEWPADAP